MPVMTPIDIPGDDGQGQKEAATCSLRRAFRAGDLCPVCKTGVLDYDGMLNLVCPNCEYQESGSFT